MGERGDKERALARAAHERALKALERSEAGGPYAADHRRWWRIHEKAALLHAQLADACDREDELPSPVPVVPSKPRGDRERQLAREAQQLADECASLVEADAARAAEHQNRRRAQEMKATMHTLLADVYDREDATS